MPSPGAWLFLTHSRANVPIHLGEADLGGIPRGRPSVACTRRVWLLGNPAVLRHQAAAQEKGMTEASSDILPLVFTREKSRLGGNTECDRDTELTSSPSTDSRVQEKGGCLGVGLVNVGKPYYQFCRLNRVFPKATALSKLVALVQAPRRHLSAG